MADVYINYEDSGRKYFRRAMYINIMLLLWAVIMYIFFTFDIIVLVTLGISALGLLIIYLVYFLLTNKPIVSHSKIAIK
ncbi:MAG: hypothetical protein RTV31_11510 [Candidatus Thorarchaeota archaeon]